jgi:hypothetical protein
MKLKLKSKLKKWKSVNDRLPKLGGQYLVVENIGTGEYPIPYMAFFDTFEQEWYEDIMMEHKMKSGAILFWTKLPEPPKGIPESMYPVIPETEDDKYVIGLLRDVYTYMILKKSEENILKDALTQ